MKKLLTLLLALVLCLLPLSSLADSSVTLGEYVTPFGGLSTLRWTADEPPESGYYVVIQSSSRDGSSNVMQLAGQTGGTSLETGLLVPDASYTVYVVDKDFTILGVQDYTIPSVTEFEDGNLKSKHIKVSMELRQSNADGKYKRINGFNASEMNAMAADGSVFSCMKYQMQMPQLAYARTFYVQLAFEAPNGCFYTDKAEEITFERVNNGYQTIWWDYAGADFFKDLYDQTGNIPPGEYKIHLYWDGYWVNTSTFRVN